MSNCSNCYNGCTEIVSDRCVKYTGIDVPVLGIQTGDSLSYVEQALITFLTSTLDGTGVKIDLGTTVVCDVVNKYLPTCKDLSIVDISKALIEAACDLQDQVDVIVAELAVLNADYTVGCLTGVTASSDTHAIVQAVINKLCQVQIDLTALAINVDTNYVRYDELNQLIQAYLSETSNGLYNSRMIPYSVLPYFGPITGIFDASGAGSGQWDKIYLCNGNNGTPDLRGRALTGVINGVPGPTLNPVVDPATAGNPNYSLYDNAGANQVTLLETQIPLHTHPNTVNTTHTLTDPGHAHTVSFGNPQDANASGSTNTWVQTGTATTYPTNTVNTGITLAVSTTITNAAGPSGGGGAHSNIQPVTACYYIQYRPV
jgi:microcystin-dependent protein